MTVNEYRKEVDILLTTLLDFDLNTINSTCCPDGCTPLAEMAFSLGVYEECISQARQHIIWFMERTKENE